MAFGDSLGMSTPRAHTHHPYSALRCAALLWPDEDENVLGRPPAPDLQQTGRSTHRAGPGRPPGPGPLAADDKGPFFLSFFFCC